MLLDERKYAPFSHADWLFEIKYNGYRMLAEFGAGCDANLHRSVRVVLSNFNM